MQPRAFATTIGLVSLVIAVSSAGTAGASTVQALGHEPSRGRGVTRLWRHRGAAAANGVVQRRPTGQRLGLARPPHRNG